MCLNDVIILGSAQYKIMRYLDAHPDEWHDNQTIYHATSKNDKAFRFSGNDPCTSHTLYTLMKAGLVEKRDREIKRSGAWDDGIERKAWVTEWRALPHAKKIGTSYISWVTGKPSTWHVIKEIEGEFYNLGKDW